MLDIRRFRFARTPANVAIGFLLGVACQAVFAGSAQQDRRVFEIRTYTTHEGKLDALHTRFRDHTMRLFQKHGLMSIGYWIPQDAPSSQNTLIYILAHPNRDAAKKNWDAFRNDPEWQKARSQSEAKGPIVSKVESVFTQATDYSPMK